MNGYRFAAGLAFVGLALTFGCAPRNSIRREPRMHAELSHAEIAELLPPDGWYPPNREALIQWLEQQQRAASSSNPPVAIFDWDNTCVFGDVEETFFQFGIERFSFRPSPDLLKRLTPDGVNGVTATPDGVRFSDVGARIRKAYPDLRPTVSGPVAGLNYEDFKAGVGWLYTALADAPGIGEDYAYRWIVFWLGGMTPTEVRAVARDAFENAIDTPIENRIWRSIEHARSEHIEYSFVHGLRPHREIQALMRAMQAVGVEVYVVSASAEPIVEAAAEDFGYPVDAEHIFGVRLKMKDGKYLPELVDSAKYPFTYREGKVEAIRRIIKANPVFVAGDSDGDYAMLTAFDSLQMRLVINRNKQGQIHTLYEEALKPAASGVSPRTLLQGREENSGAFLPSQDTKPLAEPAQGH